MDDPEHQNVEIGPAELPVGAVHRQLPRARHIKLFDDATGKVGVG
jgi:hypothetical protein